MDAFLNILCLHIGTSFLWKKRAPGNGEDPSNKKSRIMDMGSISLKSMNGILLIWYEYLSQNIK